MYNHKTAILQGKVVRANTFWLVKLESPSKNKYDFWRDYSNRIYNGEHTVVKVDSNCSGINMIGRRDKLNFNVISEWIQEINIPS